MIERQHALPTRTAAPYYSGFRNRVLNMIATHYHYCQDLRGSLPGTPWTCCFARLYILQRAHSLFFGVKKESSKQLHFRRRNTKIKGFSERSVTDNPCISATLEIHWQAE